jgi:pimeloyl-ACP methyl ester carboxylesterase
MANIVLVHGVCHGAWCWEGTCAALDARAAGERDDVAHLVYVAAVMRDRDDVFMVRAADFPPSSLAERAAISDGIITVSPAAPADAFYNECGPDDAARAAASLRPTAIACLAVPPENEPWRTIPSTYVLCERDRAIPPAAQRWMSARAERVEAIDTDHSPFLSTPERFVELLCDVAARVERG